MKSAMAEERQTKIRRKEGTSLTLGFWLSNKARLLHLPKKI